ncbi:hypothetical protein [Paracoccus laeviglucosivorans]|uniref:Uncharacterized protein n=1 Tax=Paracoccus laeviglucosivorans TaxID=1197861 RepID=A0A521AUP2_9RHOB|nr:hypothetical protein [Paracoccus laeviglucosivorans]SMO38529.1 hypothetical protein SAMN06265221_101387 [Paracoccus laeviglucosivorans]
MKPIFIGLAMLALTGATTADAMTKAERRQELINSVLPPEDRPGIDFLFPMEAGGFLSTFEIAYFPEIVSDREVQARIAKICKANGVQGPLHVRRPVKPRSVKTADGSTRIVHSTTLSCFGR